MKVVFNAIIVLGMLGAAGARIALAAAPVPMTTNGLLFPLLMTVHKPCDFGVTGKPQLLSPLDPLLQTPSTYVDAVALNMTGMSQADITDFNAHHSGCALKDYSPQLLPGATSDLDPHVQLGFDELQAEIAQASPNAAPIVPSVPPATPPSNGVNVQLLTPAVSSVTSLDTAPGAVSPPVSGSAGGTAPPLSPTAANAVVPAPVHPAVATPPVAVKTASPAPAAPAPSIPQVVNQVALVNGAVQTMMNPATVLCNSMGNGAGTGGAGGSLTPEAALQMALSGGTLQLVGRGKIDTDHIPSCVFRNRQVTVVYDYCAKGTEAESGVTITTTDGQSVQFHVASSGGMDPNTNQYVPVPPHTNVGNAQYAAGYPSNWGWNISYARTGPASAYASFAQVKSNQLSLASRTTCITGHDVGGYNANSGCYDNSPASQGWVQDAYAFSQQPSSQWFQLLKQLQGLSNQVSAGDNAAYPGISN
jgi:hypothetical protein